MSVLHAYQTHTFLSSSSPYALMPEGLDPMGRGQQALKTI